MSLLLRLLSWLQRRPPSVTNCRTLIRETKEVCEDSRQRYHALQEKLQ